MTLGQGGERTAMGTERRSRIRRGFTALFIAGALYATVVGFLWFAADFIAAAIYSPNLDRAQQVADFDDFAYIGEMLAGYRFAWGALALVMAVALLALAVLINDRQPHPRAVLVAGVVALLSQAALLSQGFQWGFALLFLGTAAVLYLVSDGLLAPAIDEADDGEAGQSEPGARVVDDDLDADETWPREPVLPAGPVADGEAGVSVAASPGAADGEEPPAAVTDVEAAPVAADARHDGQPVDEAALESLGLEIESDINLDLEPDYRLASAPESEEDPLLLLSQEDLGIDVEAEDGFDPDDTIQTAAAIEAEVAQAVPLDQANTEQIKAMIDLADENPIGTVARELNAAPAGAEPSGTGPAPAPAPEAQQSAVSVPAFDPQELARQESLLPPPRKRVWNLMDWLIVSVIIVAIVLLLVMNL